MMRPDESAWMTKNVCCFTFILSFSSPASNVAVSFLPKVQNSLSLFVFCLSLLRITRRTSRSKRSKTTCKSTFTTTDTLLRGQLLS